MTMRLQYFKFFDAAHACVNILRCEVLSAKDIIINLCVKQQVFLTLLLNYSPTVLVFPQFKHSKRLGWIEN